MTAQDLVDQHYRLLRAKESIDETFFLYPEDDRNQHMGTGMRQSFYDSAFKKYADEVQKMKEMMSRAPAEMINEARRIVTEQTKPPEKK